MSDPRKYNNIVDRNNYDSLVDRDGRLVSNKCGNSTNPKTLKVLRPKGDAFGNNLTSNYKNLVVHYKCTNENVDSSKAEVMTTEGFNVVTGQIYKSLPPCRKCGGSCPWHWDLVTHRKNQAITTHAFYAIDGSYITYNL